MARISKIRGKLVRKFGVNIFGNPKYDALLKRKSEMRKPPRRRSRVSEYGKQLAEKQKLRFSYGLSEKQFRNLFEKAKSEKGITGHNIMILLERRLDNVLYRSGLAVSRQQARQMVSHGQIILNNRRVTIPSILVKEGDQFKARDKKNVHELFRRTVAENSSRPVPPWIDISYDNLEATITSFPTRDMVPSVVEEKLIVEFYSK